MKLEYDLSNEFEKWKVSEFASAVLNMLEVNIANKANVVIQIVCISFGMRVLYIQ